jgi:class 3 adenylate cyclase/HAMP domain-containing protein
LSSNRRSKAAAPRWRLPITSTLLVGFGGLVAIAVATVMLISIRVAQQNTDQLLQQTASQRLDAAIARIDRYLQPVADDVAYLAAQLSREGDLSQDGDLNIETLMRGSLGAIPQVVAMVFVRPDLTAVRARRQRGRDPIGTDSASIAGEGYGHELLENAKRVHGVTWNAAFYVQDPGVTFISALAPVSRDGQFRGVIVAAVAVDELSLLIDSGDPDSTMFILSATDDVIAHPQLARGGFTPTPGHFLLRRNELSDPVMRELWSAQVDGGMAARVRTSNTGTRRIEVAGETNVVLLRQVSRFSRQPWISGIYFPATQMNEPITRLRLALAVGLIVLALGVGLALLLGRGLARPIRRLAAAAAAVSAFDFSGAQRIGRSPLREIDSAGRAWDSMLTALSWFETYVPKSLVGRLLGEGSEGVLKTEEREVTVMFTDIAGFSAIAQGRSPVALAAFLNRHFGLIGKAVEAAGGTIDKYIGDSVMAFWGAPGDDPDHAEHACRAALAIAEAFAADNRRRAKKGFRPVRLRIGIHTGLAVVGNVGAPGRINYTLIGDTVNAAQRLEQLGKDVKNESDCIVLASAATVVKLPLDIPRQALGELVLRGMGGFEVYRLG